MLVTSLLRAENEFEQKCYQQNVYKSYINIYIYI